MHSPHHTTPLHSTLHHTTPHLTSPHQTTQNYSTLYCTVQIWINRFNVSQFYNSESDYIFTNAFSACIAASISGRELFGGLGLSRCRGIACASINYDPVCGSDGKSYCMAFYFIIPSYFTIILSQKGYIELRIWWKSTIKCIKRAHPSPSPTHYWWKCHGLHSPSKEGCRDKYFAKFLTKTYVVRTR